MKNRQDRIAPQGYRLMGLWLPLIGLCGFLPSCQKPFEVNVNAEKPIKVDLSMDVHVYQHGGATVKKTEKHEDVEAADYKEVMERRRDRMADIQTMKDDRIIGENHKGLLSLRIREGDTRLWPMDYVQKVVDEENSDRTFLIEYDAIQKGKTVSDIQRLQWNQKVRKSHPGEWIETVDPNHPDIYVWVQKQSPLKN